MNIYVLHVPVCPSVYLCVCLLVYSYVCLSVCLFVCMHGSIMCPYVCLSVCVCLCLAVSGCVCLSICLSACLSVCLLSSPLHLTAPPPPPLLSASIPPGRLARDRRGTSHDNRRHRSQRLFDFDRHFPRPCQECPATQFVAASRGGPTRRIPWPTRDRRVPAETERAAPPMWDDAIEAAESAVILESILAESAVIG